jgi:hypothetical protein
MRTMTVLSGPVIVAAATVCAPQAVAEFEAYAMNGTFSVISNGEWAQLNERYQDKPTVRSTWTVATTCTSTLTCEGTVTSSLGWTAGITTTNGSQWNVRHDVPGWIPCPDGTRADGTQVFTFYPANPAGGAAYPSDGPGASTPDLWLGQDETTGVSGNCGRNRSLVLTLPVKITRIG